MTDIDAAEDGFKYEHQDNGYFVTYVYDVYKEHRLFSCSYAVFDLLSLSPTLPSFTTGLNVVLIFKKIKIVIAVFQKH